MTAARDMFGSALNILNERRDHQGGLGSNEQWARQIAGDLAKCDATLGR